MIPKNTKKIVSYLLRELEPPNTNRLARALKISVGSAFAILKELEKNGIAAAKKRGNALYYRLCAKNTETSRLCELILLEERRLLTGHAKIYAHEIGRFKDAELIVLFGSILNTKEFNDVDVLFMTTKVKAVTSFCLEISKIRTKPVIPLILSKKDLIDSIRSENEAILSMIRTGVVLKGETAFIEVLDHARPQS